MKPIVLAPLVALALAGGSAGAYFWLSSEGSVEEATVAQPTATPTPTPTPAPTPDKASPTPAPTATAELTPTPTVGSRDIPVPLGEPHLVQGWELTILGSRRANCVKPYDSSSLTLCSGSSDAELVIVDMRAHNMSAGEPADFNSVGLDFGLVDDEGLIHPLHSMPTVVPFLLASTSVLLQGATVEGPIYFVAPLNTSPLLLITGDGTFFSTE